jgi:hypothetical protein
MAMETGLHSALLSAHISAGKGFYQAVTMKSFWCFSRSSEQAYAKKILKNLDEIMVNGWPVRVRPQK